MYTNNMYTGILIIINVCSNMIKILIFVTTLMEHLKLMNLLTTLKTAKARKKA